MKVLIIGLGSIAFKHISALKAINKDTEIYALRSNNSKNSNIRVTDIFDWKQIPVDIDFIIISNPTSEHYDTIRRAIKLKKPLFIEKPPLLNLDNSEDLINHVRQDNIVTYVAFNYRFHPVLIWLKDAVSDKRVIEVQAYCGSYLPAWRPTSDYRQIYSASKELGGGVHLDLIHELDYLRWIFGLPEKVFGFISKKSDLEINSADCAHYWLTYERMNISVILNYYRIDAKRQLEIIFKDETWIADMLKFTVNSHDGKTLFSVKPDPMKLYYDQMVYFLDCINNKKKIENDLEYSMESLRMALSF